MIPAKWKIAILLLCIRWGACAQCLELPRTEIPGITLSLSTDAREYSVGERIVVHVSFANTSDKKYMRMETFYEHEFEIRVKTGEGVEAPLTKFAKNIRRQPYKDWVTNLVAFAPGDKVAVDEDAAKLYQLTEPGRYQISACTNLKTAKGLTIATIGSNELTIIVKPVSEKQ